jgi:putative MATE family efflux protein
MLFKFLPPNEKWEFLTGLKAVALPITIQTLVNSLVGMLDVFMVGQLGETAITSTSLGNTWFMLFTLLSGGITAAGSIFIAQYWGKRDIQAIYEHTGIMILGVAVLSSLFSIASIFFPSQIIRMYSNDPQVIKTGAEYIRIIGFSYLVSAVTTVMVTVLRSTENARLPMQATMLSLVTKLIMSYMLIFGHFGIPKLGVSGAGYATLIARLIQFLYLTYFILKYRTLIPDQWSQFFKISRYAVKQYFRYGFFIIIGETIYAIGTSVYSIAYKYTGTDAQAALQIINTMNSMAMVLSIGIGSSSGVIIGKLLGSNQLEKAKRFCNEYLVFSAFIAAIIGVISIVMAPVFLNVFKIEPITYQYARNMIFILAFQLPFRSVNFTIITGILRSGGDSLFCFISNLCGTWLFGIPLAFLGVLVFGLPIHFVYLLVAADEVGKFFICFPRVKTYKWIQNLTTKHKAPVKLATAK